MTLTEQGPAEAPAVEDAAVASERRRTRWSQIAVGVLVGGLLVGVLAWWAVSVSALGGVRVVYDAQPLRCEGTEVGLHGDGDAFEGAFYTPVVVLTPGMTCELRMHVVNQGWADVAVPRIGMLMLGEDGGLNMQVSHINPNGQQRIASPDDEYGAFFDLGGFPIPAGASQEFAAVLTYDGGAHMSQCSAASWVPPVVTVEALGAARDVQPASPEGAIRFQMGGLDECDG